jgi:hypothetical protein
MWYLRKFLAILRRDIAVKVLSSANKVSFIIGRLELTSFVGNKCEALGVDFDRISASGSRDIAVKVYLSTSKVPFIFSRLQFNTCSLHGMHIECLVWSVRKFCRHEAEIFP